MNREFVELREALQERLGVIADHELRARDPRAHLERLKAAASRLDAAIARVRPNCDPQLRHFLDRLKIMFGIMMVVTKAQWMNFGADGFETFFKRFGLSDR